MSEDCAARKYIKFANRYYHLPHLFELWPEEELCEECEERLWALLTESNYDNPDLLRRNLGILPRRSSEQREEEGRLLARLAERLGRLSDSHEEYRRQIEEE